MNIKITNTILEAIKKAMKDKSMNLSQMAIAIQISKSSISRICNGETKTMDPHSYDRLQSQFLLPYLSWTEVITKIPQNTDMNYRDIQSQKMITQLQTEIKGLNTQIAVMNHEFLEVKEENKKLKSKFNKLLNIMNKN